MIENATSAASCSTSRCSRGRLPKVLYDPAVERSSATTAITAWKPAVPGVREVLRGDFVEHAYPPHTHDTWTLFVVDAGAIRYDLDRQERGADPAMVSVLPPFVVHDGRPATTRGYRTRVIYLEPEVIGQARIGPAVDAPVLPDARLRTAVSRLHDELGCVDEALAAETHLAFVTERIRELLGERPFRTGCRKRPILRSGRAPSSMRASSNPSRWLPSPPSSARGPPRWRERSATHSGFRRTAMFLDGVSMPHATGSSPASRWPTSRPKSGSPIRRTLRAGSAASSVRRRVNSEGEPASERDAACHWPRRSSQARPNLRRPSRASAVGGSRSPASTRPRRPGIRSRPPLASEAYFLTNVVRQRRRRVVQFGDRLDELDVEGRVRASDRDHHPGVGTQVAHLLGVGLAERHDRPAVPQEPQRHDVRPPSGRVVLSHTTGSCSSASRIEGAWPVHRTKLPARCLRRRVVGRQQAVRAERPS